MKPLPIFSRTVRSWLGRVPGLRQQIPPELTAWLGIVPGISLATVSVAAATDFAVLKPGSFAHYVEHFNAIEAEEQRTSIPNAEGWNWFQENIPLFECPDRELEEIYYYRWWSFRKHVVKAPKGFVVTEFLKPVSHAGPFNTISCAAGFHLAEGRWVHQQRYLDDYITFWLRGDQGKAQPHFHNYSSWFAAAVFDRYCVNGDAKSVTELLEDLVSDYRKWEKDRLLPNGLFWQYDVRDGMEESISGSRKNKNVRPTINSYMYANARAIAAIARLGAKPNTAEQFERKAADLKKLIQENLWDCSAKFFKVRFENGSLSDGREAIGFVPWMFQLPDSGQGFEAAWSQFSDSRGFSAPFGITTAERRHPAFRSHGRGKCEWDGAVWPFATCQTLNGLGNVLRDYQQSFVTTRDYFDALLTYVHSQHAQGKPYIGEYLDEVTGDWINGRNDRSPYYNHSTFADLIITGLVGLRPRADRRVEVSPLLPPNTWDWFCLDGVKYHHRMLTVIWDKDGSHYKRGAGLRVLANDKEIAASADLQPITGVLP